MGDNWWESEYFTNQVLNDTGAPEPEQGDQGQSDFPPSQPSSPQPQGEDWWNSDYFNNSFGAGNPQPQADSAFKAPTEYNPTQALPEKPEAIPQNIPLDFGFGKLEINQDTPILGGLAKSFYQAASPTTQEHFSAPIRDLPIIGGITRTIEAPLNVLTEASKPFEGAILGAGNLLGMGVAQAIGKDDVEKPQEYIDRIQREVKAAGKENDLIGALNVIQEKGGSGFAAGAQQLAAAIGSPVNLVDVGLDKVLSGAKVAAHVKDVEKLSFIERALNGIGKLDEAGQIADNDLFKRGGVGKFLFRETPESAATESMKEMSANLGQRIAQVAGKNADLNEGLLNLQNLTQGFVNANGREFLPQVAEGAYKSKYGQQIARVMQEGFAPEAEKILKQAAEAGKLLDAPEFVAIDPQLIATKGQSAFKRIFAGSPTQPEVQMAERLGTSVLTDPLKYATEQIAKLGPAKVGDPAWEAAVAAIRQEAKQNVLAAANAAYYAKFVDTAGDFLANKFETKFIKSTVRDVGGLPTVVEGARFTKANPNALDNLANSLKSFQSTLVLGLNPGFPIRNFWNNASTMLMRGNLGFWTPKQSAKLAQELGINPRAFIDPMMGGGGRGGLAELASKMPFLKLSRLIEGESGRVAWSEGAHKAMAQLMREGKGFTFTPELKKTLQDMGYYEQVKRIIERQGMNQAKTMGELGRLFADPENVAGAAINFDRVRDMVNGMRAPDLKLIDEDIAEEWIRIREFFDGVRTPQEMDAAVAKANKWLDDTLAQIDTQSAAQSARQVKGELSPKEIDAGLFGETPQTAGARAYTADEAAKMRAEAPALPKEKPIVPKTPEVKPTYEDYQAAKGAFDATPLTDVERTAQKQANLERAARFTETKQAKLASQRVPEIPAAPVTTRELPNIANDARINQVTGKATHDLFKGEQSFVNNAWKKYIGGDMPHSMNEWRQFAIEHPEDFAKWEKYFEAKKAADAYRKLPDEAARAQMLVERMPDLTEKEITRWSKRKSFDASMSGKWNASFGVERPKAAGDAIGGSKISSAEVAAQEQATRARWAASAEQDKQLLATAQPTTPGYTRAQFHQEVDSLVGKSAITEDETNLVKDLWDARARTAVHDGLAKTPDEYFSAKLQGVQAGETTSAGLKQTVKGATDFVDDGRAVIRAFEQGDVSTLVHESAHVWRRDIAGEELVTLERWAGVTDGVWQVDHEEKFARAFEKYLHDGQAPAPELNNLFGRFKEWLHSIYQTIVGSPIDVEITPEVRQVFDRMIAGKEIDAAMRDFGQSAAREYRAGEMASGNILKEDFLRGYFKSNGDPIDVWFNKYDGDWRPVTTGEKLGKRGTIARPSGDGWVKRPISDVPAASDELMQKAREALPDGIIGYDSTIEDLQKLARQTREGRTLLQEGSAKYAKAQPAQMFADTNADLPLFSGTAPKAKVEPFKPTEQAQQMRLEGVSTAPEFGAKKKTLAEPPKQQGQMTLFQDAQGDIQNLALTGGKYQAERIRQIIDAVSQIADYSKPMKAAMPQILKDELPALFAQIGDVKVAARTMGEWARDTSLLNYEKRYGYNSLLGMVLPYEFWLTSSLKNWSEYFIDRPGMLAMYAKMRDMLYNRQQEPGYPERLRGTVKIPLPFIPQWMGGGVGFVDPLNALLPFEQMSAPLRNLKYTYASDSDVAQRIRQMVQNGEVEAAQAELAIKSKKGQLWDSAKQSVHQLDANPFDVGSLASSPIFAVDWLMKMALGKPEEIRGMLPIASTIKGATAVAREAGIGKDMIPAGGVQVDPFAALKPKLLGAEYDPYEGYRIDRALVAMVSDGLISEKDAKLAMIERKGKAFDQAVQRASLEQGVSDLTSLTGFRVKTLPSGELKTNLEKEQLTPFIDELVKKQGKNPDTMTYDQKKALLKETGKWGEVGKWYEAHPAVGTNITKSQEPEVRLRDWYQTELWDKYNGLNALDKRAFRSQNPEFAKQFVNSDTRKEINAIPLATLAQWTYAMRGYTPQAAEGLGKDIPSGEAMKSLNIPQYQPQNPQEAKAYDEYLTRLKTVSDVQDGYYALPEKSQQRRDYLIQHPELKQYWDWVDNWEKQNPALMKTLDKIKVAEGKPPSTTTTQTASTGAGNHVPYGGGGGGGGGSYRSSGGGFSAPTRYTTQDPSAMWRDTLFQVTDSELLGNLKEFLSQPAYSRATYAQKYPKLLQWLQGKDLNWIEALSRSYLASLNAAGMSAGGFSAPAWTGWGRVPGAPKQSYTPK